MNLYVKMLACKKQQQVGHGLLLTSLNLQRLATLAMICSPSFKDLLATRNLDDSIDEAGLKDSSSKTLQACPVAQQQSVRKHESLSSGALRALRKHHFRRRAPGQQRQVQGSAVILSASEYSARQLHSVASRLPRPCRALASCASARRMRPPRR